jgi:flagellar FliL protein
MSDEEQDTTQDEAESQAPPPKKKGRSKLLMIGLPLIVLLAGGGAGWWYFMQPAAAAEGGEAEAKEESRPGLVSFEPFVVNLADPGGRKFLRVAVQLLVPDESVAAELEEDELEISRVRSAILELLTTRSSAEINNVEGRAALKKAIAETAHEVGHLEVRDVLFKEFVVQ